MEKDSELSQILQAIAEKSLRLVNCFKHDPTQHPFFLGKYAELLNLLHEFAIAMLKNPEQLTILQEAYWEDAMDLLQEHIEHWLSGTVKLPRDKRFQSEEWASNPFFNLLSQQYLLAAEHLQVMLQKTDLGDKKLQKRIQFLLGQYLDALSPSNFLNTNPELIAETIRSQGKNILIGLNNLLSDLEKNAPYPIIKMSDEGLFQVGKTLATTSGMVIFRNDLMELIQYRPQTETVRAVPLLIIPPWINKFYILDLSSHNSLVRWLTSQGITVFMISWVNPQQSHANKGMFDYLQEGPLTAIRIIKKQLRIQKINALGFCIGGTLLAMLLAYLKARKETPIRSATFLATLIDFEEPGDLSVFIDEPQIKRIEQIMNEKGYLDGRFLAYTFNSLRASDLIWSFFINNYLRGRSPVPFDLLYWNADNSNMPAKMHSEYLRWMYLNNDLVKPQKIHLNNTPLTISDIDVPSFFVSTQKDHISPWQSTYRGFRLLGGPKQFILGGSGHVAGIVIPPGSSKYGYYRNPNCPNNPEEWLATAEYLPGSWWPEWLKWLKKKSGRLKKLPELNQLSFQNILDAPGSYVHQR